MLTDPRLPLDTVTADVHPAGIVRRDDSGWFAAALDDAVVCTTGDLTLDLHQVEFMDASGIRILCECAERLRATGRRLVLAAPAYIVERAVDARLPAGHIKIYRS
jgi:anti-anti-sigma factor